MGSYNLRQVLWDYPNEAENIELSNSQGFALSDEVVSPPSVEDVFPSITPEILPFLLLTEEINPSFSCKLVETFTE